jgi:hypothetical protein
VPIYKEIMRCQLSSAALLALGSFTGSSNAFTVPLVLQRSRSAVVVQKSSTGGWDNEDFLRSLQPPKEGDVENRGVDGEDVSDQGGSRFKAMLEATKKAAAGSPIDQQPRAIPNPFLTPPPPPPTPPSTQQPPLPSPIQLDNLSVEDQARLFRQLMGQSQTGVGAAPVPYKAPPPTKQDARGGRPLGRNRDADSIANTADLYFAQLKRDSTVRTQARYRGELDKAEAVFEDEGIVELNDLLRENPYLKG